MRIIEIEANESGGHNNQTINGVIPVPDGWAVIPDDMTIPDTFPFVNITVADSSEDGAPFVTSMTAGVVPDPESDPEPEPTEADDTAAMLVDHEYRLTMLELGILE